MTDRENKKQKDEVTPITDGDFRPDKQLKPDVPASRRVRKKDENKKITEKRAADTDSLEDFKDAL